MNTITRWFRRWIARRWLTAGGQWYYAEWGACHFTRPLPRGARMHIVYTRPAGSLDMTVTMEGLPVPQGETPPIVQTVSYGWRAPK